MILVHLMKTVYASEMAENYRKLISLKMPQNDLDGVPLNSKTILKFDLHTNSIYMYI